MQIAPSGSLPLPRFGGVAIYDSHEYRMVISSGRTASGFVNDTWSLALGCIPIEWRHSYAFPTYPGDGAQSPEASGEDWWYDHANSFIAGTPNGYICAGYSGFVNYTLSEAATGGCLASTLHDPDCNEMEDDNHIKGDVLATLALVSSDGATPTWYRTYGEGYFRHVIQTNDGGYVAIGVSSATRTPGGNPLFYDPNRDPGNPTDAFGSAAACTLGANVTHMLVVKTDASGAVQWEYLYGMAPYRNGGDPSTAYASMSEGWGIVETPTHGFMLVGNAAAPDSYFCAKNKVVTRACVIEIDANGAWIGGDYYGPTDLPSNAAAITKYADGGGTHYVVSGTEMFHDPPNYNGYTGCDLYQRVTLNQFGPNWPLAAQWTIGNIDAGALHDRSQATYGIDYQPLGPVILFPVITQCIGCLYGAYNRGDARIYRVGTDGTLNGFADLGTVTAYDLELSVVATPDGGCAAASTRQATTPPAPYPCPAPADTVSYYTNYWSTDALVAKCNSAGVVEWSTSFDFDGLSPTSYPEDQRDEECIFSITQDGSGGFVVGGTNSFNFDDCYLAKVGCVSMTAPQSIATTTGETVTFAVTATGAPPFSYQWRKNGVPLSDGPNLTGSLTSTLKIIHAQAGDAGNYAAQASNACATVTSPAAALSVACPQDPAPIDDDIVAWWTFDAVSGGFVSDQVHTNSGANRGVLIGAAALVPALANNAVRCLGSSDGVRVQNSTAAGLDFDHSSFTIDAWIFPRSGAPSGVHRTIATKGLVAPGEPGFSFYVVDGRLGLEIRSGTGLAHYQSAAVVTDDAWHHVAVVVDAAAVAIRLFVDGAQVFTQSPIAFSATSLSDLYVGTAQSNAAGFMGDIDELSMYRSALAASTIQRIAQARCAGKRGEYVRIPMTTLQCETNGTARVCAVLCNRTASTQTYTWTAAFGPAGPDCSITPLQFVPPQSASPVAVAAGANVLLPIDISATNPPVPIKTCYHIDVANVLNPMHPFSATGSLAIPKHGPLCVHHPGCSTQLVQGALSGTVAGSLNALDASGQVRFRVSNDSTAAVTFAYTLAPVSDATGAPSQRVSLGNQPPGIPLMGSVQVPPADSVDIAAPVSVVNSSPFLTESVVLLGDLSRTGHQDSLITAVLEFPEDTTNDLTQVPTDRGATVSGIRAAPNPFATATALELTLAQGQDVSTDVYDVAGRLVVSLHHGWLAAGPHRFMWDGRDLSGHQCVNGIYLIRAEHDGARLLTKVVLVK
jgi:hypothetical protein